jgi:hypothetical protein
MGTPHRKISYCFIKGGWTTQKVGSATAHKPDILARRFHVLCLRVLVPFIGSSPYRVAIGSGSSLLDGN